VELSIRILASAVTRPFTIHDCVPKSNIFCEMIVDGSFPKSFFLPEGWFIFADLVSGEYTMVMWWLLFQ
jgi:hypothetical protein